MDNTEYYQFPAVDFWELEKDKQESFYLSNEQMQRDWNELFYNLNDYHYESY